ncbi:MAG: SDR family NAD(P)-dependent oxidoreductase [Gammaproteobacteria bacterium]
MASMFDMSGRVVLVTGASRGLGQHMAVTLARHGAKIAVTARRTDSLSATVAAVRAAGAAALAVALDVTRGESIREAAAEVERDLGPIDVLVNNAGVTASMPALEQTEAVWDEILDTNLKGPFLMAQEVARQMLRHKRGGSIVNIGSILGLRQAGAVVSYAVSKAGLTQLTRILAFEWARHGIRVNALAPGYFSTELNREFLGSDAGQALVKRIPQRRLGNPEELDGALLLLASGAGSYMTGTVIPVDGGHLVGTL